MTRKIFALMALATLLVVCAGSATAVFAGKPTPTPTPTPVPSNFALVFQERTSWSTGGMDLYLIKSDGSQKTRLTKDRLDNTHPAWSPDGTKIAFHATTKETQPYGALFGINPDGTGTQMLCTLPYMLKDEAWCVQGGRIDWSPDMKNIVYNAQTLDIPGSGTPATDLVVVNLDTCAYTLITDVYDKVSDPWAIRYFLPTWSHKRTWDYVKGAWKTQIATATVLCNTTPGPYPYLLCPAADYNSEVLVIDVWLDDAGQIVDWSQPNQYVNLTHTPEEQEQFSDWDPTGTSVVFSRWSGNCSDCGNALGTWRVHADGTDLVKITDETLLHIRWSPDAEYLASAEGATNQSIYRSCAVDGSGKTFLYTGYKTSGADWNPLWTDDLPAGTCP